MAESTASGNNFIGYDYREISVERHLESIYADGYQSLGWIRDGASITHVGLNSVTMKFKRDRKIRNKAELTRLQRQFDACVNEIISLEKSRASGAAIAALVVGVIGTAFMAGATFAFLGGLIVLCIILAVPGFIGWALPCYLYKKAFAKKTAQVTPLIEEKYDEIYEICERGSSLLEN